jgi:hypothetical protein
MHRLNPNIPMWGALSSQRLADYMVYIVVPGAVTMLDRWDTGDSIVIDIVRGDLISTTQLETHDWHHAAPAIKWC